MSVFPQLSSGAIAQFPIQRGTEYRTIINESMDGSEIVVQDVDFEQRRWALQYDQLSDPEWQAIEDLFVEVNGRLGTFLFLEPGANLVSWSELLSEAVWLKDPGVSFLENQPDPLGGTLATRLTNSGATESFRQGLNIPASYRYAGSVWARTADSGVELRVDDDGPNAAKTVIDSSNAWKRYEARYDHVSASAFTVLRIEMPPGTQVEIFGPQLEAQPAASVYKPTGQQAGMYPAARFDQDALADRAEGVGLHSGVIRILWTPSLT
ncbi:MAG: hypothetical protein O2968_04090 [Acidobacteria bacterium]|nr:hypothetical protein [Acidobacteriota bacterium]